MKIILSPAKKMISDTDSIAPACMPDFLDQTTKILDWMRGREKDELKAIWKCNDKIAMQNFENLCVAFSYLNEKLNSSCGLSQ